MAITLRMVDGVALSALRERQGWAAWHGGGSGRQLGGRSGFRVGTPSNVLTATSTTWTLGACSAALDPGAQTHQGMYGWSSDANETGAVTAADATNPRKDIVYIQLNDSDMDTSGAKSAPVLYLAGTPSVTPAAPVLPARSFLVGTITVPQAGGGSPTVALNPARYVAAGGVLPVEDATERNSLTGYDGFPIARKDVPGTPIEVHNGTGWDRQISPVIRANTQTVGNGMATDAFTTGTLQPVIQAGTFVGTTTAGGDLTITYPATFPNGVIGGIGFSGDGTYIVSATPTNVAAPTTSSLFLRFANPNGAVAASTTVRGTWMAVGW